MKVLSQWRQCDKKSSPLLQNKLQCLSLGSIYSQVYHLWVRVLIKTMGNCKYSKERIQPDTQILDNVKKIFARTNGLAYFSVALTTNENFTSLTDYSWSSSRRWLRAAPSRRWRSRNWRRKALAISWWKGKNPSWVNFLVPSKLPIRKMTSSRCPSIRDQCYKTFYVPNFRVQVRSKSVYTCEGPLCGLWHEPALERSTWEVLHPCRQQLTHTNIWLGRKGLQGTHNLAYYEHL